MNCEFCGEPLESGRHPLTESGARDVTRCQVAFLLDQNSKLSGIVETCCMAPMIDGTCSVAKDAPSKLASTEKDLEALRDHDDKLFDHYDARIKDLSSRLDRVRKAIVEFWGEAGYCEGGREICEECGGGEEYCAPRDLLKIIDGEVETPK